MSGPLASASKSSNLDDGAASPPSEPDPNRFTAYVLHKITPRDSINRSEFEKFAIGQLLPHINTSGEPPDQHALLDGAGGYLCLSRLTYGVHQTPLPTWLSNQVQDLTRLLREGLHEFGDLAEPEFYYDVAAWRRKLGK
jgi:hypothetical protein